jgi:hypothetical protein
MAGDGHPWLDLRRHLTGPEAQLDFPVLEELAAAGGSDYFAEIVRFGSEGDPSHGTGIAYLIPSPLTGRRASATTISHC